MSRKSARQSVDINVRSVLNRERSARSMRLPQWSLGLLDGEGRVRGRTWRQMPGTNPVTKACNWWLWKRNKLDLSEAMTEERAVLDCSADEERGAA